MIIIQVAGGLGNQLQQYALYRKLVRIGKEVRLDISWFDQIQKQRKEGIKTDDIPAVTERNLELRYFDRLIFETCTKEEKEALIGNEGITGRLRRKMFPDTVKWFHETKMYHPEIFEFEDMYLSGYFACEKYYSDILYDLREKIQFPPSSNLENERLTKEMNVQESVSVHIRRGDYLKPENAEMFGSICTEKYYEAAIGAVKEKYPMAHFYIFSDDISYVKKHYSSEEYTIVDINHGRDSFYDMYLMSQCKHNICANSTFSFWGARLNRYEYKMMIRPTIHKNSQVFIKGEMQELWPEWSFISPDGIIQ